MTTNKKKSELLELLQGIWWLFLFLMLLSILGSTIVILLSLFLFLVSNKKLRVFLFLFLFLSNAVLNIILIYNPFDFEIVESLSLWYTKLTPEGIEYMNSWPDYEFTKLSDFPEYISTEIWGVTTLIFASLINDTAIGNVLDAFFLIFYFVIPFRLAK